MLCLFDAPKVKQKERPIKLRCQEASSFLTLKAKVPRVSKLSRTPTLRKNTQSRSTWWRRPSIAKCPNNYNRATLLTIALDISCAMLCMYISQCARRDGIEHGSIINIFLLFVFLVYGLMETRISFRARRFKLNYKRKLRKLSFFWWSSEWCPEDFLSSSDLNCSLEMTQLESKVPQADPRRHETACSLRLIRIPFATFPLRRTFFSLSLSHFS